MMIKRPSDLHRRADTMRGRIQKIYEQQIRSDTVMMISIEDRLGCCQWMIIVGFDYDAFFTKELFAT